MTPALDHVLSFASAWDLRFVLRCRRYSVRPLSVADVAILTNHRSLDAAELADVVAAMFTPQLPPSLAKFPTIHLLIARLVDYTDRHVSANFPQPKRRRSSRNGGGEPLAVLDLILAVSRILPGIADPEKILAMRFDVAYGMVMSYNAAHERARQEAERESGGSSSPYGSAGNGMGVTTHRIDSMASMSQFLAMTGRKPGEPAVIGMKAGGGILTPADVAKLKST